VWGIFVVIDTGTLRVTGKTSVYDVLNGGL